MTTEAYQKQQASEQRVHNYYNDMQHQPSTSLDPEVQSIIVKFLCFACPIITLFASTMTYLTVSSISEDDPNPLTVSGMVIGGIGVGAELVYLAKKVCDCVLENRKEQRRTPTVTII